MEDVIDRVVLDQSQLLAVDRLNETIDAVVLAVEDYLGDATAGAVDDGGVALLVPRVARHVEPQVGGHAVAYAQRVNLSGIKFPVVVLAHAQQPAVFLLTDAVHKLDVVVALVLVAIVGHAAAPLEFGQHVTLAAAVGRVERHGAKGILIAELAIEFEHGEPCEGDVAADGLVTVIAPQGEEAASSDAVEADLVAAEHCHAVDGDAGHCGVHGHHGLPLLSEDLLRHAAQPDVVDAVVHGFMPIEEDGLAP